LPCLVAELIILNVEKKMHYVAIGYLISLAFCAKFAGVACSGFSVMSNKIVVRNNLSPDKTALKIII